MAAHGGNLQHLAVGQVIVAVHETQRVFHAVTLDARFAAALVRGLDCIAQVDGDPQIGLDDVAQGGQQLFLAVEFSGHAVGLADAGDRFLVVRREIVLPHGGGTGSR